MKKQIFFLLYAMLFSIQMVVAQTYKTIENISYKAGDAYVKERCKLDLYYPEGKKDYPTVIWFHGGGLEGGNKFIPEQLKQQGIAVVAVNYRFLTKVKIDDCIDDAAAAVAWTFKEIGKYGGSTKKIVVSGHSAGGYLADMILLDKKWLDKYKIDADSIAGCAPFSGQVITHFNVRKAKGIGELTPMIDAYAPLRFVRKIHCPMIIVSGDRNQEIFGRYEEQAYFWRMMKLNKNDEVYLYELDGYDHGAMAEPAFHILLSHLKKMF